MLSLSLTLGPCLPGYPGSPGTPSLPWNHMITPLIMNDNKLIIFTNVGHNMNDKSEEADIVLRCATVTLTCSTINDKMYCKNVE